MATVRDAMSDVGAIKRSTLRISIFAISSAFIFEFIAGISTNSLALLTDSTHALLDVVVTLVLIIASTLALKPRDTDHTYGHGKVETIGGFIGGTALFVVAIFFIYEAAARITVSPQPVALVNPGTIGFAAVIYTLFIDVFRIIVLKRADSRTGASTIRADLYHALADLASTAVAFAGLWFVSTGFVHGDSVAAMALGAVLAFLSSRFVYRNATELTDVISPRLVARVRQAASSTDGVLDCTDIRMRRVGREIFVEVTVALRGDMSFENAHETSAKVEQNIVKALGSSGFHSTPTDVTVHFEPIISLEIAPEALIEKAATSVLGVSGVHNILVSKIGGSNLIGVSLHVQVKRSATLTEAHTIADSVEESIKHRLKGVGTITVHLEPRMPDLRGLEPLSNSEIRDSIRNVVGNMNSIAQVGRIAAYRTDDNMMKIDVECVFKSSPDGELTIEEIHEKVSEIEKEIRGRYPGSIVTVHAEPS